MRNTKQVIWLGVLIGLVAAGCGGPTVPVAPGVSVELGVAPPDPVVTATEVVLDDQELHATAPGAVPAVAGETGVTTASNAPAEPTGEVTAESPEATTEMVQVATDEEATPVAAAASGPTAAHQSILDSLPSRGPAPELHNEIWLNSEPLKLSELRGKVVLLDMWTFG